MSGSIITNTHSETNTMSKQNTHKVSGLDSVYGGSMFRDESVVFHILDARDGTDTYRDLAKHNIEMCGSAIVAIVEDRQVA